MGMLIFYTTLSIGVSFLCSIMEAVLLSVTPGHLAALEAAGDPVAPKLRRYKDDIDKPLAAILSLNTIAHTVGAAGAGAQAAIVFDSKWVGLFSALLTLAILFLSEIIPKTIGAVYWKQLTNSTVRLLSWLMLPLKPLVFLSGLVSGLISKGKGGVHISREEFNALADMGAKQGVLAEDESRILRALLRFRSLRAHDIMTPRTVAVALPEDTAASEYILNSHHQRFSRVPLYSDSLDHITGYILKDDVLHHLATSDDECALSEFRRDVLFVPSGTSLSELLEKFLGSKEHIAVVVDEYGGTEGILTLEDVVETLLDMEIVDEFDSIDDLRSAARRDWEKRAARLGLKVRQRTGDFKTPGPEEGSKSSES
ncbi:MAG: DUF21 domain-containing protein [Myxococcales bacterium]|nr:DUF21 domain-containing protein [Myxococcales bacterium]